MNTAGLVRFYTKCPRCGVRPGQRCRPIDPRAEGQERSNHPARRKLYTERRAQIMREAGRV